MIRFKKIRDQIIFKKNERSKPKLRISGKNKRIVSQNRIVFQENISELIKVVALIKLLFKDCSFIERNERHLDPHYSN